MKYYQLHITLTSLNELSRELKYNEKLAENSSVGYISLKLLMNYEFGVILVSRKFHFLVKLCSHQLLKFSFPCIEI